MNIKHYWIHTPLFLLLVTMMTACSSLSNGQRRGENAAFPSWEKFKSTAWKSARDPQTWVLLAGALVLSIGDLDEDLSDWDVRETPLFGSNSSADDASDDMRAALGVATIVSVLSTPGGPGGSEWVSSKSRGVMLEASAFALTEAATSSLKSATGRTRPNEKSNHSFPSSHASGSFSFATLTSRNVDAMHLSPPTKKVVRYSANTLAGAIAWARVEAKKHYPTDVLAGAALGHFLTAVIHDSMMADTPVQVGVQLDGKNGGMLTFHMPF